MLVVGAGGFIGGAASSFLEKAGHDVVSHDWSESGDLKQQDLRGDFDVVLNAAGRLGAPGVSLEELEGSNRELPRLIADAWRDRGGGFHVIHLSTPGVTGLVAGAWEYLPFDPPADYERTKAQGETILREAIPDRWLVILRPDFVYGPGDTHKLALWKQIGKGWIPLVGRGRAMIRPTYVDDVCRAISEAVPGGRLNRGNLYNIGGPRPVSVRQLYETISDSIGADRLRLLRVPPILLRLALLLGPLAPSGLTRSRLRLLGRSHYVLTGKAWQAGFRPQSELDDGIRRTTAWYREHGLV